MGMKLTYIIFQDVFATDASLGMATTAGSYALWDACPSANCQIVNNVSRRYNFLEGF